MKKHLTVLALTLLSLLVLGGSPAWAKCPEGLTLRAVGTPAVSGQTGTTNNNVITTSGVDVKAIGWACVTGQACSFGVYNEDVPSTAANIQFEGGSATSGGDFMEFETPINFNTGVSVGGTNIAGVIVYACVAP